MISHAYVRLLAQYNRWQNESLYGAASTLSDQARRLDRGAFFKSIHETLNHILWGDRLWLSRFGDFSAPEAANFVGSMGMFESWDALCEARRETDAAIIGWADTLDEKALEGDLTWLSGALGREVTRPRAMLIAHMFNHQTHHRGQVHAMLTAAGATPDDTDIPFMPGLDGADGH